MSLGWRQTHFYRHRCDLYAPSYAIPAGGDPTGTTYSLAASDVPCKFVTKSAVDEPGLIGLTESGDMVTVDELHLAEDQAIETNWVVVNKSLRPDGTQGGNYGDVWTVRGSPKRVDAVTSIGVGKSTAFLSKLPDAPAGVG